MKLKIKEANIVPDAKKLWHSAQDKLPVRYVD
jgi:hypothetical protein